MNCLSHLRGFKPVMNFAMEMLTTLNTDKNARKSHWESMTIKELREKLREEREEVDRELDEIEAGNAERWAFLADEMIDEANVAMMIHDRAIAEVLKCLKLK